MNVMNIGAAKRAKLSLHLGGRSPAQASRSQSASPTLSDQELRRIVAEMID